MGSGHSFHSSHTSLCKRNNGTAACASCKHQRKKCTEKCVLAPLFPANKSREFQVVHKVFGVSNVTKIVKNLKEEDRKRAADSLVWEAFCRQRDPVLGPYGEYARVYEELKFYKSLQLSSTQGGMVYKPTPNLGGLWTKNKINMGVNYNNNSNGTFKYINSGNSIADLSPCSFSSDHDMRQEKDAGSVVLLPQQHNSLNDFNYQYYLPGQFGSIEDKQMETTLWEGSS